MAKNKALAIGLVGAGIASVALLSRSASASPKATKKVPASNRQLLSAKYAKMFGVPLSLLLATTYAQSKNNPNAYRVNNRGGSWGLGQITLKTAKEIYPTFKSRIQLPWDLSGKGLLNPALNLALTAAYLSVWWARYKAHKKGWMLASYAYVLGPGRVRQVMPKDDGKLPLKLPADFLRVKAAYTTALKTSEVQKALGSLRPDVSGLAPLTGKALANTIPKTITGYQARALIGKITGTISNAYATLKNYDPSGIAEKSRIDAGSIKQAREYLDSTNAAVTKYYKLMPESHGQLTSDQLTKLRAIVSISSVAVKFVDDNYKSNWLSELLGEIQNAAKQIISKAADTVGLDKTSAALMVGGLIGVGVLVLAIKK